MLARFGVAQFGSPEGTKACSLGRQPQEKRTKQNSAPEGAETTLESGDIGITESDLRPAGVARFGELRQSVVTEGEFIDTQKRVVVTEVRGSRVVVEAAASDNALPT